MSENVFTGTIIAESLEKKDVLDQIKITKTDIEPVTAEHQTPWIKQWTLHAVEIPESQVADIARAVSQSLDSQHPWYADFKNDQWHFIIFRGRVFKIDKTSQAQYDEAKNYGISSGIPAYQVDFHPEVKKWDR